MGDDFALAGQRAVSTGAANVRAAEMAATLRVAAHRAAVIAVAVERARRLARRTAKRRKLAAELAIAEEELARLRGQLAVLEDLARPTWLPGVPAGAAPGLPPPAPARPAGAQPDAVASAGIDIIICVHNAQEDVRRCLDAVIRHTEAPYRLTIVDDASDAETATALREFVANQPAARLLRNPRRQGYTRSANRGLQAASGDVLVLLNSDAIVTPGWLGAMLACLRSDARLGIVGPLSNAASYQSVPERFGVDGDWSVNPAPPGWDAGAIAAAVARVSDHAFPRVPLVNGFCFMVTRAVIEAIGAFDATAFPDGYGEENDFCLRAADAGFALAIADQAYVHHAKSRSYTHAQRRALGKAGRAVLQERYGRERLEASEAALRAEPALARVRAALATELRSGPPPDGGGLSVLFLLPVSGGGGGAHSVVQEACGMRALGVPAQVAIRAEHLDRYRASYPGVPPEAGLFFAYRTEAELEAQAARWAVVVATISTSVPLLARIAARRPEVLPAYYVQDYEPFFYPEGTPGRAEAARSYTLLPQAALFAKTDWLCETIGALHGVTVQKVQPSLDHAVYAPRAGGRRAGPPRVAAMIRPSSPRRGAGRTMKVLRRLAQTFGAGVELHIFGARNRELAAAGLRQDFPVTNHGVLTREAVAALLRECDIFLDLSDYQAFGRTGLEAMASGCAVVLPALGGVREYARHGENALLIDTSRAKLCMEAASALVTHADARQRLQAAGLATAAAYSIEGAAQSEIAVLEAAWRARRGAASVPAG
ncbi:MAG: glycosyltransferase [Thermomicrobiales bacterium]